MRRSKMILKNKATDPLDIDLVKAHLMVEHNKDDLLIQSYIDTSLGAVENFTHKPALIETHETFGNEIIDGHKDTTIEIPLVKKPDNVFMIFAGSRVLYESWNYSDGTLYILGVPPHTQTLPDTIEVEIGTYATDPHVVNQSRMLLCGSWYTMRANSMDIRISELPDGINNLLLNISAGSI